MNHPHAATNPIEPSTIPVIAIPLPLASCFLIFDKPIAPQTTAPIPSNHPRIGIKLIRNARIPRTKV